VKFLVDNQLPRALATLLENLGHHAVHVLDIELSQVDDLAIWAYAAQYGYTIIPLFPRMPTSLSSLYSRTVVRLIHWPASFWRADPLSAVADRKLTRFHAADGADALKLKGARRAMASISLSGCNRSAQRSSGPGATRPLKLFSLFRSGSFFFGSLRFESSSSS